MNEVSNTCYMCDAPATSGEHVPPKCLFPERKDLPPQTDLRKNLFKKVPSCDSHNSQKSQDDEYFLYVLSTSFQINEIGRNLYRTKVRRAIKRNASVLGKIASTATPVTYSVPNSDDIIISVAHKLDEDRFNTMIDRLARAIYFYHSKEKWTYGIRYQAEFLFATINQSDKANARIKEISRQADEWFSDVPYIGENREVFKYQALEADNSRIMRLHFYEGCKLLLIFNSQQQL